MTAKRIVRDAQGREFLVRNGQRLRVLVRSEKGGRVVYSSRQYREREKTFKSNKANLSRSLRDRMKTIKRQVSDPDERARLVEQAKEDYRVAVNQQSNSWLGTQLDTNRRVIGQKKPDKGYTSRAEFEAAIYKKMGRRVQIQADGNVVATASPTAQFRPASERLASGAQRARVARLSPREKRVWDTLKKTGKRAQITKRGIEFQEGGKSYVVSGSSDLVETGKPTARISKEGLYRADQQRLQKKALEIAREKNKEREEKKKRESRSYIRRVAIGVKNEVVDYASGLAKGYANLVDITLILGKDAPKFYRALEDSLTFRKSFNKIRSGNYNKADVKKATNAVNNFKKNKINLKLVGARREEARIIWEKEDTKLTRNAALIAGTISSVATVAPALAAVGGGVVLTKATVDTVKVYAKDPTPENLGRLIGFLGTIVLMNVVSAKPVRGVAKVTKSKVDAVVSKLRAEVKAKFDKVLAKRIDKLLKNKAFNARIKKELAKIGNKKVITSSRRKKLLQELKQRAKLEPTTKELVKEARIKKAKKLEKERIRIRRERKELRKISPKAVRPKKTTKGYPLELLNGVIRYYPTFNKWRLALKRLVKVEGVNKDLIANLRKFRIGVKETLKPKKAPKPQAKKKSAKSEKLKPVTFGEITLSPQGYQVPKGTRGARTYKNAKLYGYVLDKPITIKLFNKRFEVSTRFFRSRKEYIKFSRRMNPEKKEANLGQFLESIEPKILKSKRFKVTIEKGKRAVTVERVVPPLKKGHRFKGMRMRQSADTLLKSLDKIRQQAKVTLREKKGYDDLINNMDDYLRALELLKKRPVGKKWNFSAFEKKKAVKKAEDGFKDIQNSAGRQLTILKKPEVNQAKLKIKGLKQEMVKAFKPLKKYKFKIKGEKKQKFVEAFVPKVKQKAKTILDSLKAKEAKLKQSLKLAGKMKLKSQAQLIKEQVKLLQGFKAEVLVITKQLAKVATKSKQKTKAKLKTLTLSKKATKAKLLALTKTKAKQAVLAKQKLKVATRTLARQRAVTKAVIKAKQKTRQRQAVRTRTVQKQKQKTIPKRPTKPPKKIRVPTFDWNTKIPKGYTPLVTAFYRSKGKVKRVARTTPNRAFSKVNSVVDNTLSRSFDMKIVGITKTKDIKSPRSMSKYRLRRGRDPRVLKYVEKSRHSIDTKGEKTQLRRSRRK